MNTKIDKYFEEVEDPRREKSIDHKLIDIIVIAVCAVISGADNWNDIEDYGKEKENWLEELLELPNGIPSHDTIARVFQLIDPNKFEKCFQNWIKDIVDLKKGEVIAIDGKTQRGSLDKNKSAIHTVSAWARDNKLVLGQIKTEEKSNEITAIPELLDMLDIEGTTVTIDAMGCQKAIVKKIRAKKANYTLGLKGNQGKTHRLVKEIFKGDLTTVKKDEYTTDEVNRDRKEKRKYTAISVKDQFEHLRMIGTQEREWIDLKSIIEVESRRETKEKVSTEKRYYISSLDADAKELAESIRGHWSIENTLHWSLDINFRADESRIRKGHSQENFVVLKHLALSLLKQEKSSKRGLKGKRLKAGWNNKYLLTILKG